MLLGAIGGRVLECGALSPLSRTDLSHILRRARHPCPEPPAIYVLTPPSTRQMTIAKYPMTNTPISPSASVAQSLSDWARKTTGALGRARQIASNPSCRCPEKPLKVIHFITVS